MTYPFGNLRRSAYRVILADPPWQFNSLWGGRPKMTDGGYPSRAIDAHYDTMSIADIAALPVADLAQDDCVLFMWTCWPVLRPSLDVIDAWGFTYKTCGFSWLKVNADGSPFTGLGYWTRANTEPCLLATRGRPKRRGMDVAQALVAQRREHSRKPDDVHGRIERLIDGPYVELFARARRAGWDAWGNQVGRFDFSP